VKVVHVRIFMETATGEPGKMKQALHAIARPRQSFDNHATPLLCREIGMRQKPDAVSRFRQSPGFPMENTYIVSATENIAVNDATSAATSSVEDPMPLTNMKMESTIAYIAKEGSAITETCIARRRP
jgi:hypothetical protein